jgi:hypothetical protein
MEQTGDISVTFSHDENVEDAEDLGPCTNSDRRAYTTHDCIQEFNMEIIPAILSPSSLYGIDRRHWENDPSPPPDSFDTP